MSNSAKVERKLAAIMFTDIAGYTESMSYDESQAITTVKKKRSIIQPLIKEYNGVFVKEIGDGTLSYFSSAIDASTCAVKLQELTYDEEHLNFRVGLHIGDIVFDGQDVFGEGVNIASRLESLSPVGGICVSKTVYDELENKKEFNGTSLGLQSLKGVGRLVEVYALKGDRLKEPDTSKYKETEVQKHSDDEVPSIAIIPFTNKGADEDVFYAYGISADLISDCSSAGLIRVASLNNIEKIENYESLQAEDLASKLDVRYTAEGTLWKMGEMFQLSIELYDTTEKKVVWSDRWQEKWDNLPSIKGNLSDGLLKALNTKSKEVPKLETTNTEAYELYLKAKHKYLKRKNTDDTKKVRQLLNKAIELDNYLISAKNLLGTTYRETNDYDMSIKIHLSALKQAKESSNKQDIGISLLNIGNVHWMKRDLDKALDCYKSTLEINEDIGNKSQSGNVFMGIGNVIYDKGDFDKALCYYKKSLELNEQIGDKHRIASSLTTIANVHSIKGRLDKALDYHQKSFEIQNDIGDKYGMGITLYNIGGVYQDKMDYERALDYCERSFTISKEIGDKEGTGFSLNRIGVLHYYKGDYEKALDYYERSFTISEKIDDKYGMGYSLNIIGSVHYNRGEYNSAVESLEKSLAIQKEIGLKELELFATTYIYLCYRHLRRDYDVQNLIKKADNIEFELNFRLYQLVEDSPFLETAYNQIQEKADTIDGELKEKFLNYPIPKQIIEEYNKVFS